MKETLYSWREMHAKEGVFEPINNEKEIRLISIRCTFDTLKYNVIGVTRNGNIFIPEYSWHDLLFREMKDIYPNVTFINE